MKHPPAPGPRPSEPSAPPVAPAAAEALPSIELYQIELAQQNEELRDAREELARSLRRYADLYERAPVGLLTLDSQGTIVQLNRAARAQLGAQAAPGQRLLAAVPAASREALHEALVRDTGQPVTLELEPDDAGARWMEVGVASARDVAGVDVLALSDVTRQRRIETELRRTQDILALSNRIARIGHWEADLVGARLHWSEVTCEIHGVQPGQEPDLEGAVAFYTEGPCRDRIRDALAGAIERAETFDLELQIRNTRGDVVWVRVIGIAEHAQGRCQRLYGTFQDIDTRMRLEQARLAQGQAEAASQAKSAFLSRMSHELRTPLNAVLGFSQLLQADPQVMGLPSVLCNVRHIQHAGELLLSLVDEVLDLARVESGRLQLEPETLDLGGLVLQCVSLLDPLAAREAVRLHAATVAQPALAVADHRGTRQVLTNLLSNAIKYTGAGGRVDVTLRLDGPCIAVSVQDNGPGLGPEQLAHLFEPFNRLGAERGAVPGTGLGLIITRQLMEAMGGTLTVHSQVGAGSTFTAVWPRPVDTPAAPAGVSAVMGS